MKLAYAAIRVRDLATMAAWYERLLNRPPDGTVDPKELERDPWVQFTFPGGAAIALLGGTTVPDAVYGGDYDRGILYLDCPVAETLGRLRDAGVRTEGPVLDGPLLHAVVVDPEGNRIRLMQWM
jgi:catechol 2,3-dioxygenase-like lactoylglutathione lyase family enzyme